MISRVVIQFRGFLLHCCAGLISRVVPRTSEILVVGGNRGLRYADNSMYFFKYCCENHHSKVVWLTHSREVLHQVRSEGRRAFLSHSLIGLYYGFRARWHVFDVCKYDTSGYSSVGANILNMWHGYPIKDHRVLKRNQASHTPPSKLKRFLYHWPADNSHFYMLHQNREHLWQITESFDVRPENVIIANYPRNIVFENEEVASKYVSRNAIEWIDRLRKIRASGSRILGYFPTWRGDGSDSFLGTRSAEDIVKLNQFLATNNLFIATKWHSCVFGVYDHVGKCSEAEDLNTTLNSQSNIVVLGFEQDLNSILGQCDMLISDYSGVIVDFLLSDRPQIFMAYDLEAYRSSWGFSFNYEEFIPGPLATTLDQLNEMLLEYASAPVAFAEQDASIREIRRHELFDEIRGSEIILERLDAITEAAKR